MIEMNYATNFALLDETNTVTGVAWGMVYNMPVDFPGCVQVDSLPVQIGDVYDGTDFYRDGAKVLSNAEQMAAEMADMQEALELLGVTV